MGPQESMEDINDDLSPVHLRKIFIGNLDYATTEEALRQYFTEYGEILKLEIMFDNEKNISKGYGFCTYANSESVDNVLRASPHFWENRTLEIKRTASREEVEIIKGDNQDKKVKKWSYELKAYTVERYLATKSYEQAIADVMRKFNPPTPPYSTLIKYWVSTIQPGYKPANTSTGSEVSIVGGERQKRKIRRPVSYQDTDDDWGTLDSQYSDIEGEVRNMSPRKYFKEMKRSQAESWYDVSRIRVWCMDHSCYDCNCLQIPEVLQSDQTKSLHVSGIHLDMNIVVLREAFRQFGKVVSINILIEEKAALVEFGDSDAVDKACSKDKIFVNNVEVQVKKHVAETKSEHKGDGDFQKKFMMKLDRIKDLQLQQLTLLQNLPTNVVSSKVQDFDFEDVIMSPATTMQELDDLDLKVSDPEYSTKLITFFSSTLNCAKPGDTVRKIMRKIAINDVLSCFTYKGRNHKRAFQALKINNCIIKACRKSHPDVLTSIIEDLIKETLRFAPYRGKPTKKVDEFMHMEDFLHMEDIVHVDVEGME